MEIPYAISMQCPTFLTLVFNRYKADSARRKVVPRRRTTLLATRLAVSRIRSLYLRRLKRPATYLESKYTESLYLHLCLDPSVLESKPPFSARMAAQHGMAWHYCVQ